MLGAVTLLSGCVTTDYAGGDRYARLYDACDAQAGACYRSCDEFSSSSDRALCQDDCSLDADRCFADLNSLIRTESLYELTRDNFYGRYGAWYPGRGYRYGAHGYSYRYPYRYLGYYYSPPRSAYDERDDDHGSDVYDGGMHPGKPNRPSPRTETLPLGEPRNDANPVRREPSRANPPTRPSTTPPPPPPTRPTTSRPSTPRPTPPPKAQPRPTSKPKSTPKSRQEKSERHER